MSEMVERAQVAFWKACAEQFPGISIEIRVLLADGPFVAMIEALREPTEPMLSAMGAQDTLGEQTVGAQALSIWQAAIDTVLKETA